MIEFPSFFFFGFSNVQFFLFCFKLSSKKKKKGCEETFFFRSTQFKRENQKKMREKLRRFGSGEPFGKVLPGDGVEHLYLAGIEDLRVDVELVSVEILKDSEQL